MLLEPGLENGPERFYLTRFALNTSSKASGVSQLHTKLSAESWPGYSWVNVTNGVHFGTWQDGEIPKVQADPNALWQRHLFHKQALAGFVQQRTGFTYDPERLVITWARRLAGYKRFTALFEDVARLATLVKQLDRPVQILIAGKAHRYDAAGKQQLQSLIHIFQQELAGYALFVPNYDIDLAQQLVKGSDLWLNTPELGKEACGTSGMKAISNGVLQCTTSDGWTAEVKWDGIGWVLDDSRLTAHLYELLEREIVPMFYERTQDVPLTWVKRMQASITLSESFSAARMLRQYQDLLYSP